MGRDGEGVAGSLINTSIVSVNPSKNQSGSARCLDHMTEIPLMTQYRGGKETRKVPCQGSSTSSSRYEKENTDKKYVCLT